MRGCSQQGHGDGRCIVTVFHARSGWGLLDGVVAEVTTMNENSGYRVSRVSTFECLFYLLYCDTAWSENADVAIVVQAIQNGALEADIAGAAIQNKPDLAVEITENVLGAGRTRLARGIGTWCSKGGIGNGNEGARDWMGGHPDGDGRLVCGNDAGYLGRIAREEEGEWAGPESVDQSLIRGRDGKVGGEEGVEHSL